MNKANNKRVTIENLSYYLEPDPALLPWMQRDVFREIDWLSPSSSPTSVAININGILETSYCEVCQTLKFKTKECPRCKYPEYYKIFKNMK